MLTQTLLFLDNVCSSVRLFEFMQKVYLTIDTDAHIMIGEVKVKVRFTYLAPQAAYAASAVLCVTDRAVVQPRPPLKPAITDSDKL